MIIKENNIAVNIPSETFQMLKEMMKKYPLENNASIIEKAIRNLYDVTCRHLGHV